MPLESQSLIDTPFLVVDLETTGFDPYADRVVEVAAVKVGARINPKLVLSTLVNPERPIPSCASDYHGLQDDDVASAPAFADIIPTLHSVMANRVLAAHNAKYDMAFLEAEFGRHGRLFQAPHVCTMRMRTMLGLDNRLSLESVVGVTDGIQLEDAHSAACDAMAAAQLLQLYLKRAHQQGVRSFKELANLPKGDFTDSFKHEPLRAPRAVGTSSSTIVVARGDAHAEKRRRERSRPALRQYADAVLEVVSDLELGATELHQVKTLRKQLDITAAEMRSVHARVFAMAINRYIEDRRLDDDERAHLRQLHLLLDTLGWAPGH